MQDYTDVTLVTNYLDRELTTNEQAILPTIIKAIKVWIDGKLDSTFGKGTASSRYYDGGSEIIDIDPVTSISSIQSVDTNLAVSETYTTDTYILEPLNETVKRQIRLRSARFPKGDSNIKVTGIFTEFSEGVPQDIQLAATRLAGLLLSSNVHSGFVQRESIEGHSVEYATTGQGASNIEALAFNDPIVKSILKQREPLFLE